MGGEQSTSASYKETLDLLTSSAANAITQSSTRADQNQTIIQFNQNSRRCKNIVKMDTSLEFVASSTAFQSQYVYQSMILDVMQQVKASQEQKSSGGSKDQSQNLEMAITDIINTTLSSDTMVSIGNDFTTSTLIAQVCTGAAGGINYVQDTQENIMSFYSNLYSKNASVQKAAAQISQTAEGDQSQKSSGFLTAIAEILMILVAGLLIIGVVIIVVILAAGWFYAKTITPPV